MDTSRRVERRGAAGAAGAAARAAGRGRDDLCDALWSLLSIAADLCWHAFGHPLPPFPRHAPPALLRALQRVHTEEFSARLCGKAGAGAGAAAVGCVRSQGDAADVARVYAPYVEATYKGAPAGECPERVGDAAVVFGDYEQVELWSPCFYVAKDDALKRFVVAVRGTKNFNDIVTDVLGDAVPFGGVDGAVAHRGFVKASKGILEKIRPVLKSQLANAPGYGVTLCGHSLGAACSSLLLKMMQDEGCYGEDLMAVAIACPPCFAPLEAVNARWANALYAYVHADDIIPRASLFTLRNLLLHFSELNKLKLKARKVDELPVAELKCSPPSHGKPVYWKRRCKQVPGLTADCPDPKCQALAAQRRRDDAYAVEHGTFPAGYDHARSRHGARDIAGSDRAADEERDGALPRNAHLDTVNGAVESKSGDSPASKSVPADLRKRQAANAAAELRYRSLLRFTHHHEEDVKEIPELVIPAPRGVHWIVSEASKCADLNATGSLVSHAIFGGVPDCSKSDETIGTVAPHASSDRGPNESKPGCFPKSGSLRRKMSFRQRSLKEQVLAAGTKVDAITLDESDDSDAEEEAKSYFLIRAEPPRSFQPVFLTSGCIEAHHFKQYKLALDSLVT